VIERECDCALNHASGQGKNRDGAEKRPKLALGDRVVASVHAGVELD
jgi:hypothetical protein